MTARFDLSGYYITEQLYTGTTMLVNRGVRNFDQHLVAMKILRHKFPSYHADVYTQDLLRLLQLYQQQYPQPHADIPQQIENIDLEYLTEDLLKLLGSMKFGAERIREIVASLRNLSRMDEAEMKEVNIHDGINSTLMILQQHSGKLRCDSGLGQGHTTFTVTIPTRKIELYSRLTFHSKN